jgi:hypothetical protein
MIGHGALWPGGDADLGVLLNDVGAVYGDESTYELPADVAAPEELEAADGELDRADGAVDGQWREHDLGDTAIRDGSPAYVEYQQGVLQRVVQNHRFGKDAVPDLLFTNFKSPDVSGHFWSMSSPEVGQTIAASDRALQRTVTFLNRSVGRRRWVVIVTADHGQMPSPRASGGWAIRGSELELDLERRFDKIDNDVSIVERINSAGVFVNGKELDRNEVSMESLAGWLATYSLRENLLVGQELPDSYREIADDPVFDAILDGPRLAAVSCDDKRN